MLFTLSMPGRNTWNGRWSGDERRHTIVRKLTPKLEAALDGQKFRYSWPDGWMACITVEKIDGVRSRKERRLSNGFCGYEWMVNSIIQHGVIKAGDPA